MADLTHVTDASFEADVAQSTKPVLVDFWAPWCGPCRMMEPVLGELADEYGDKITIAKLNVDENPATATRYEVLSIPTLLVFEGSQVVKKLVGAMPKKKLVDELATYIG